MTRKKDAPEQEPKPAVKPRRKRAKSVQRVGIDLSPGEENLRLAEKLLETNAIFNMCASVWGPEKVLLRASKFGALELMQSASIADRVLALQRMVLEDLTLDKRPTPEEIPGALEAIMNEMAEQLARRSVEENIEKKISQKMEERHQEFVQEIRMQILKEETSIETPQTQKKLEKLNALEEKGLTRSMNEMLRPASLDEIVGQDRAVEVLRSKLASPYPPHLILFGPLFVG